jgi:hypothetical protein
MLEMPYIRMLESGDLLHQFQLKPVGTKAHVQVCGTTPCMLRGAEDLIRVCKAKIHPSRALPVVNATGTLSWEEVECQGACVNAPMVMIFKDTYEDLTKDQLRPRSSTGFEAGEGESVKPGPQIDRHLSAPAGRADDAHRPDAVIRSQSAADRRSGAASMMACARKDRRRSQAPASHGLRERGAAGSDPTIAESRRSQGTGWRQEGADRSRRLPTSTTSDAWRAGRSRAGRARHRRLQVREEGLSHAQGSGSHLHQHLRPRMTSRLKGAMPPRRLGRHQGIIDKGRDWIINEMKASGLRGRGGAGFPTG